MSRYRRPFTLVKIGKIYYFRVWNKDNTKRICRTTGCTSKERAMMYADGFIHNPEKMAALFCTAPSKDERRITFGEYAKNWWIWDKCPYVLARRRRGTASHPGIKRSYVSTARSWTENYLIPYLGSLKLNEITSRTVEYFFGRLKTRHNLSPKSINNIRSILMIMFKEAVKMGLLSDNPVAKTLQMIVEKKPRDLLSEEEAYELLKIENIDKYWDGNFIQYSINLLAAFTSMRQGEIRGLRKVDITENGLVVQHSYGKFGMTTTKTSDRRVIPITKDLRAVLQLNIAVQKVETEFVFASENGKPVNDSSIRESYINALHKMGIDETERKRRFLTFHSWRSFFATSCVAANIEPIKIMKITGHRSIDMLSHYTNLREGDMEDILSVQNGLLENIKQRK